MSTVAKRQRTASFNAFSWLADDLRDDRASQFAARIKDLAYGVKTCLQLIEVSDLEREHCRDQDPVADGQVAEVPLLSMFDTGNLLRLAVTVSEIIGEQTDEFIRSAEMRFTSQNSAASSNAKGEDHA